MNFTIIHRNNPQDFNSAGKYYPAPVYHSTINLKNLANEIAHSTSLTASDVKAVIEELIVSFERHLINGEKLKLDGLGTFKTSFSGEGSDSIEEVSAKNIDNKSIRVTFVADNELKKSIRNNIILEKEKRSKQTVNVVNSENESE